MMTYFIPSVHYPSHCRACPETHSAKGSSDKPIKLPTSTLCSLPKKFTVHFHQIESSGLKEQRQTHVSLEQQETLWEAESLIPLLQHLVIINKLQLKALR